MYNFTYIEMRCIGDYADFVVYDRCDDLNAPFPKNMCVWMVPGSWRD